MKKILKRIFRKIDIKTMGRIQRSIKKFYTKDLLKRSDCIATVGDYSYGKPNIFYLGEKAKLSIGKFCAISDEVDIFLGGNHRVDWLSTYPFSAMPDEWPTAANITGHPATKGDVVIGNDVWIGYGAKILSGVTIGDGAVIGAYALVTKDVSPYTIVGGNPAKEIRKRFDDETINKLLELQWWNWPIGKIEGNMEILCSSNIEKIFKIDSIAALEKT